MNLTLTNDDHIIRNTYRATSLDRAIVLSLFGVEFTLLGVLCGGLLLIGIPIAALQNIFEGRESIGESIGGCIGGIGCLIVLVLAMAFGVIWADNPFVQRQNVISTGESLDDLPNASSPPEATDLPVENPPFILSSPSSLELEYDAADGNGKITWDAARWMPNIPPYDNRIEYEIFVHYPDDSLGPYKTEQTSYQFDYLNADNSGGVRIELKAVGTIRDEDNEYYYTGGMLKTAWTPSRE